jgi:hypothetical protein
MNAFENNFVCKSIYFSLLLLLLLLLLLFIIIIIIIIINLFYLNNIMSVCWYGFRI